MPPKNLEAKYVSLWWEAVRILYGNCGPKGSPKDKRFAIVASIRKD